MSARDAVERVLYDSCLKLDDRDFKGYIQLCDPEFHYTIRAHSPEIRKDMIWLEQDRKGMELLFNNLPRHNSDHSPLTRHATLYTLDVDESKGEARAVSALQVFRTTLDGGTTELFAVGRYLDRFRLGADGRSATLLDRTVKLDTRMLGIGYHVPF